MCGIWALLLNKSENISFESFFLLSARGPDQSYLIMYPKIKIGFHRLAIMDLSIKGDQPFKLEFHNRTIYTICNGEIYNFHELIQKYNLKTESKSDCEVIIKLYTKIGISQLVKELHGEYAFVIIDMNTNDHEDVVVHACRDYFGIRPLFISYGDFGIGFSSEIKGFCLGGTVEHFKPRNYMTIFKNNGVWTIPEYTEYYSFDKITNFTNCSLDIIYTNIRDKLYEAVKMRLVSDRPLGCLLSGGLDSSLISSIASKLLKETGKQLLTFSIGMPGSTDETYAKIVANYIGSNHTHVIYEPAVWLDTIEEIIKCTETYDTTTIRATTAQYLISKWISENTNIKVLLIGDGSDELCSGYMYFHNSPCPIDAHYENINLLENIHFFDVLRADRGIASNGLEARVPFLDKNFVEYYLNIDPNLRVPQYGLEKHLLRHAFKNYGYLPDNVLMRPKEAMSDGISSQNKSWYQIIQEHINSKYTEDEFLEKTKKYVHNIPKSKESLYYREIFELLFENKEHKNLEKIVPYYWLPKWCGNITEPSARVLNVYKEKNKKNDITP